MRFARILGLARAILFLAPLLAPALHAAPAAAAEVLSDRRALEVPGCNATTWWQVPDRKDVFLGRVLRDATAAQPCATNDTWALAWGVMDWANDRIVSRGRLFALPLEVNNEDGRFAVTSAYDPSVMLYRGRHWLAFECYGPDFQGVAAACMAPLNLERGIDASRLYVAVEGRSRDAADEANPSASVPKLLSVDGRAFLYWTSVRIRKSDNVWLGLSVRGVELVPEPGGDRLVPKGHGARMPSDHPLAVEVMAPEPGSALADAYEVRRIGSAFYLFGSTGDCLIPTERKPGCYRLTIRRAREPLGRHIFNRDRLAEGALPSNPVQYMRLMETPKGQLRLFGQTLAATEAKGGEPEGYFSYAFDLDAASASPAAARSDDGPGALVDRAYRAFLGRPADPEGLRSHALALQAGTDKRALIAGLLLSAEARRTFGWDRMSDEAFVDFLYRHLLGRPADPGGAASWLGEIARGGVTREACIERFLASEEFAARRPEFR